MTTQEAMRAALTETLLYFEAPAGSPRTWPVARANLYRLIVSALGGKDSEDDEPVDSEAGATDAEKLSREIWPLVAPRLAGRPAVVQSAVLADLTAKWLGGFHVLNGTPEDVAAFREEILRGHVELVRDLVPINEKIEAAENGNPNR